MATAHPIEDKKGDWYNIGTSFTTGCKYQVLRIPAAAKNGSVKDGESLPSSFFFITLTRFSSPKNWYLQTSGEL